MNRITVLLSFSLLLGLCLSSEAKLNTEPTLGALRRKATAAIDTSTAELTRILSVCNDSGVKLSQSIMSRTATFTQLASSKASAFSAACRAALGMSNSPDRCEQSMSCESETTCSPGNVVLCAR